VSGQPILDEILHRLEHVREPDELIEAFLNKTGLDVVHLQRSRSLVDNGASSFTIMHFLMNLEDGLSVEFSEGDMQEIMKGPISGIAATVQRAVAGT
jgi:acyl carrier protein